MTQGQSHSPRMLCTKMHPRKQDRPETHPAAPAVLPGNIPAGWGEVWKSISLFSPTRCPAASLLPCSGSALAEHSVGWEGFELSWLKFNPSPAARAVSATTVPREHELPLLLPHASLSCQLPALSTFLAASDAAPGAWPGWLAPSLLPCQVGGERDKGHGAQIQLEAARGRKNEAKNELLWKQFCLWLSREVF